jgi:hypothetical protein
MSGQPLRMTPSSVPSQGAEENRIQSECLLLDISGETWYVPFDTLEWVPRVGESIQVEGRRAGKVAEVEYQFTPANPPVRVGEKMSGDRLYARPKQIRVRVS